MPVPGAVWARCRAILPPGQEIRYILPALSVGSPGMATFLIVVTDQAISVLSTKFFDRDVPTSIYATHARRTRLGPVEFSTGAAIDLGGMVFEIDDEYGAVVRAADAEVFAPETLPADPLPDL
ncbi:hypothetical protein ACFFMN_27820 [Planobispora siamensis]|uniref:Uncharacterized protein n=1 Tax=Planobispora siamensis TaxID=936338 RepID=A0A8J3SRP0_9ACTN|nr:hypothetical protein [Planobispora siamensis]GIH97164.1 hypothetical protein Psi01_77940 [Planobispora siamensis]